MREFEDKIDYKFQIIQFYGSLLNHYLNVSYCHTNTTPYSILYTTKIMFFFSDKSESVCTSYITAILYCHQPHLYKVLAVYLKVLARRVLCDVRAAKIKIVF